MRVLVTQTYKLLCWCGFSFVRSPVVMLYANEVGGACDAWVRLYGRGRSTVTSRLKVCCDWLIVESIMCPTLCGLCSPVRGTLSCAGRRGSAGC